MKRGLFCILLVIFVAAGARAGVAPAVTRGEVEIFAPTSIKTGETLPLVLLLHGYIGTSSIINSYFGLSAEVEKRRFILIVPNGLSDHSGFQYWNATSACCDFDHRNSDDVRYLVRVIRDTRRKYPIDRRRIFVAGHSNGAFMANRLACEPRSPVLGIVSFAGAGFLNPADCHATHPVRVLQIHAVDDDTIHFDGDPVGYPGLTAYPSVEKTLKQWKSVNHCAEASIAKPSLQLTRFSGGIDTDVTSWKGCAANGDVELWKIRRDDSMFRQPHTPYLTDQFADQILGQLGIN